MKNFYFLAFFLLCGVRGSSQLYISKQSAQEDLDYYNKNLEEIHIDPFLFVDKHVYFAEVEKTKENLPDSVKLQDFIFELSRLMALMEDSHSSPGYQQPRLSEETKKNQFFPYRTVLENERLFVAKDSSLVKGIPPGSEITAINGKPVPELLSRFYQNIGGIAEYKKEMVNRLFFHHLFLAGVEAPFSIDYVDPALKKHTRIVEEGITHLEGLLRAFPAFSIGNSYDILEGKVGYIKFNSMFGDVQEWLELLKKAFAEFQEKKIRVIAVDIRDNAGGNSTFGDVLFGFITSKEFRLQGYRKWKVSQQYKDHLIANGNSEAEYLQKEVGSVWRKGSCESAVSLVNVAEKFSGKVYLLTGSFTFSSGMMVADAAKHFELAELIGEPTGENTTDFGEVLSLTLPNSGVVINLTSSLDIGADCNSENFSPVTPDVLVNSNLQEKINSKDMILEYVLSRTREGKKNVGN